MKESGPLAAYIVPSDDSHMSEYVSSNFARRAFISGFTGSAGTAIVLQDKALLWTDGRYFLQADTEMDSNWTLMKAFMPGTPSEEEWLSANLTSPAKVGIDPTTCSIKKFKVLQKTLRGVGLELTPVTGNLIDQVWDNAPAFPCSPVSLHPVKFAGEDTNTKLAKLRHDLSDKKCSGIVLSALDDIAWLYNLRGNDVNYNPVFYSYAIVTMDSSTLFVDEAKCSAEVKDYLASISTTVAPYDAVFKATTALEGRVLLTLSGNAALGKCVDADRQVNAMSPIHKYKAIKNDVELKGMRDCHVRDGAALCQYLHWLGQQGAEIDEVDAADKAEYFRSQQDLYVSLSFDTISSVGANGAVIHYKPEKGACKQLDPQGMYLCDSGAQYYDGTTDVTRTVHLGTPTEHQIDMFTKVLQGHINLAKAIFPPGTKGTCLDALARTPLWNVGLNYQHGTGHGVGSFLNVHEGPCRISAGNRISVHEMGLEKGMVLSDEPGYYESGAFGIRIESLVEVVESAVGPEKSKYLTFKVITMAPIDRKLINVSLLDDEQLTWINNYHKEVLEKVGDHLGKNVEVRNWLTDQCRELTRA